MNVLRAFFRGHRHIAALLIALALAMKVLVPAGYMVAGQARTITVEICADASGGAVTRQVVIPHKGLSGAAQQVKADGACAFSALGMAGLAGADPALLLAALAFILALGFVAGPALPRPRAAFLRPPLRGPPAFA